MKIRPIEFVNDIAMKGYGLFTIETSSTTRSLIGLFWQKEQQEWIVNLFFLQFYIRA